MLAIFSIFSTLCSQAVATRVGMCPLGRGMCPGKTSHQEGARSRVRHVPGACWKGGKLTTEDSCESRSCLACPGACGTGYAALDT